MKLTLHVSHPQYPSPWTVSLAVFNPDASQSLLPFYSSPVKPSHQLSFQFFPPGNTVFKPCQSSFCGYLMTPLFILPCLLSQRTSAMISNNVSSFHACFPRQVLFLSSPSIQRKKTYFFFLLNIRKWHGIFNFHSIKS